LRLPEDIAADYDESESSDGVLVFSPEAAVGTTKGDTA
jgi:hypothetical protein